MALRNGSEVTFRPVGLSDAVDGTNVFAGAMRLLSNLIPDPQTQNCFVARPAAQIIADFAANGFNNPGEVSGLVVIGDRVYGVVPSDLNPGKDQPFVYDLAAGAFLIVNGITAANTPATQPTTGDWTPPQLAQVAGRVIVTHPGFPGGGIKFGWFDISGFSVTTTADTNTSTLLTGNPSIIGVQPGMTVSGAGITPGTTVLSTANVVLSQTGATHSNTTLDGLPVSSDRAVGQIVTGAGIPAGTTVAALASGTSVTLSQAATASATVPVTFTGATIRISTATAGSANGVAITVAGGTLAQPLWGAGDTDINPLPIIPVDVAQYNGRAYFALGADGIALSDSGFPTRITNATQFLTTSDGLAVTAIAPLMLSAPLTGGIVQSLVAFEGASKMQQISGDPSTATLSMNALPVATGTLAPNSIFPCSLGTGFVSPQGLRIIGFDGTVSQPIGEAGKGMTVPFLYAINPSRICASANASAVRITVKNGYNSGQANEEYWYDLTRRVWTGPHTSTAGLIQPWRGNSFVMTFAGIAGKLYQSDVLPNAATIFIENNVELNWAFQPTLLPDSGTGEMVAVVDMTLACMLPASPPTTIYAVSDFGEILDTTTIATDATGTLWNEFNWNEAFWNTSNSVFRQRSVDWNLPLVFKQMAPLVTGGADFTLRLGNVYMKYQRLGYKLQEAS